MRLHARGYQVWWPRPLAASGGGPGIDRPGRLLGGGPACTLTLDSCPELGENTSLLFGPQDTRPGKGAAWGGAQRPVRQNPVIQADFWSRVLSRRHPQTP